MLVNGHSADKKESYALNKRQLWETAQRQPNVPIHVSRNSIMTTIFLSSTSPVPVWHSTAGPFTWHLIKVSAPIYQLGIKITSNSSGMNTALFSSNNYVAC